MVGVMKQHYIIDFVYTETTQQFGTEADLTEQELSKLTQYLERLERMGEITDAHIRKPGASVHQDYDAVRKEIHAALRS